MTRAEKRLRYLARSFIDIGGYEIDPSFAELLRSGALANVLVGRPLEPRKLQRDLLFKRAKH